MVYFKDKNCRTKFASFVEHASKDVSKLGANPMNMLMWTILASRHSVQPVHLHPWWQSNAQVGNTPGLFIEPLRRKIKNELPKLKTGEVAKKKEGQTAKYRLHQRLCHKLLGLCAHSGDGSWCDQCWHNDGAVQTGSTLRISLRVDTHL